jgi:hypothetical protein
MRDRGAIIGGRPNYPRLTYSGPPIVRSDAERLADILALIRRRCPELSADDLALLTRSAGQGQASRRRRVCPSRERRKAVLGLPAGRRAYYRR